MNIANTVAIYSGGQGSGCNPAVGKCGRRSDRAEIARRTYVPVTSEKILISKANERTVASIVGGTSTKNNSPFDVLITNKVGIEVKTVFPGVKHDKITMHPDARERKFAYAQKNGLKRTFTVVFDERNGKVYYAKGLKSFRLRNMTEISVKKLGSVIK